MKAVLAFCSALVLLRTSFSENPKSSNVRAKRSLNPGAFPSVIQITPYNCGPAVAQAILAYWNLSPNPDQFSPDYVQTFLQNQMHASEESQGTTPNDWINTMNSHINGFNLNGGRTYSHRELPPGYSNANEFYRIVSSSLNNNVPAVLAFSGTSADFPSLHRGARNHFVVIIDVVQSGPSAMYTYMDPGDGQIRHFNANYLPQLLEGVNRSPSYLITHLTESDIASINQNVMDLDIECNRQVDLETLCDNTALANPDVFLPQYNTFMVYFFHYMLTYSSDTKRPRREANNPKICLAVSSSNPVRSANDRIEIIDEIIYVILTRQTGLGFVKFIREHNEHASSEYLKSLLLKIKQKGSVLPKDREQAAETVIGGYGRFYQLLRNGYNRSPIEIVSYRGMTFAESLKKHGINSLIYHETELDDFD
jgi:hypothetical protein